MLCWWYQNLFGVCLYIVFVFLYFFLRGCFLCCFCCFFGCCCFCVCCFRFLLFLWGCCFFVCAVFGFFCVFWGLSAVSSGIVVFYIVFICFRAFFLLFLWRVVFVCFFGVLLCVSLGGGTCLFGHFWVCCFCGFLWLLFWRYYL